MKLFNKKQLEHIKLASKDETRQVLCGLRIEGDSTVSTDGHRLMKVTWNKPRDIEDWPANGIKWTKKDKPFILPRSTVEKALRNIPKRPAYPILENVAIGLKDTNGKGPDKFVVQTSDLENTDNVEGKTVEGKYPDYKQIMPDYENLIQEPLSLEVNPNPAPQYIKVGLNARYLKEICTQLEKYKDRSHMITLHVKEADSPVCITADDGEGTEAVAVVMPMKL